MIHRLNNNSSRLNLPFLLDSCYTHCFVCGTPFPKPPLVDRNGYLEGRALILKLLDEYGDKVESFERICRDCWFSDLGQFAAYNTE